jgi:exodeoxyribonuclease-3
MESSMILSTWNVNSVRVREERLVRWLGSRQPDVVCLQELKCLEEEFPIEAVRAVGYHAEVLGQKSYNGVAILSRTPMSDVRRGMGHKEFDAESRLLAATIEGVRVICAYVPAGGENTRSPKYTFKIRWLRNLIEYLKKDHSLDQPLVLCGDFNIAPTEADLAVPDKWRESAIHNPELIEIYEELLSLGLLDNFRQHNQEGNLYTWWDYNDLCYQRNEGLRIDHILSPKKLEDRCYRCWVDWEERRGEKPSDHAPMLADFDWAAARERGEVSAGSGKSAAQKSSFIAPEDLEFGEEAGRKFVRSLYPDLVAEGMNGPIRVRFRSGHEEPLRWNYFPAGVREWSVEGTGDWHPASRSDG